MTAARVDVTGLTWRPWGRRAAVLRDVDLHLEPGERVLLAGPSGAGKSTLLRALVGQLSPDDGELAGSVSVDGVTGLLLQDPTSAVVADRAGRDTAFGPENVALPRDEIWSRVRDALRDSGFPYDERRPTSALSGGEGQRLALAGALALRPGLLLLDEPTAMLDAATAARVREAVLAAVEGSGCTLVVVEHRMQPWLGHVDRMVVLSSEGAVTDDGAPGSVLGRSGASLAAEGLWLDDGPSPVADVRAPHGIPLLVARDAAGHPLAWRRGQPAAGVGPVDAAVTAGAVTTVTGPSGAGKSTVLAMLAGLSAPTSGAVLARADFAPGRDLRPHRWRSRDLAARVAWLPQLPEHALVARTVRDEVLTTSRALRRDDVETGRRAAHLLEALGLTALADQDPHHLSGGEQRRLGLAAALAHAPRLLLLDEPTVGQDRRTWQTVVDTVLGEVTDGTGVVVASHDGALLAALSAAAQHRVELGDAASQVTAAGEARPAGARSPAVAS